MRSPCGYQILNEIFQCLRLINVIVDECLWLCLWNEWTKSRICPMESVRFYHFLFLFFIGFRVRNTSTSTSTDHFVATWAFDDNYARAVGLIGQCLLCVYMFMLMLYLMGFMKRWFCLFHYSIMIYSVRWDSLLFNGFLCSFQHCYLHLLHPWNCAIILHKFCHERTSTYSGLSEPLD